jgi:hypothetical protein
MNTICTVQYICTGQCSIVFFAVMKFDLYIFRYFCGFGSGLKLEATPYPAPIRLKAKKFEKEENQKQVFCYFSVKRPIWI